MRILLYLATIMCLFLCGCSMAPISLSHKQGDAKTESKQITKPARKIRITIIKHGNKYIVSKEAQDE